MWVWFAFMIGCNLEADSDGQCQRSMVSVWACVLMLALVFVGLA